jgi:hypothetical protein
MAQVRSARGDVVNFELIAIKQQLANAPVPVSVDDRRRFIDEKDGIRVKQVQEVPVPAAPVPTPAQMSDALSVGLSAAKESAEAIKKNKPHDNL